MMDFSNDDPNSIKHFQSFSASKNKSQVNPHKSSDIGYNVPFHREKYDSNIRKYLFNSDENWILIQYNLSKTFMIHNSIMKPKNQ